MNQFSHSCVPYEVRKLAALAQALIAWGTWATHLSTLNTPEQLAWAGLSILSKIYHNTPKHPKKIYHIVTRFASRF
jgi:hypothetical protein